MTESPYGVSVMETMLHAGNVATYAQTKFNEERAAIMARADISLAERVRMRDARVSAWMQFFSTRIEPAPLLLPDAPPFEPWDPSHREIL